MKSVLGGKPLLSYLRYNCELSAEVVQEFISEHVETEQIASLSEMDAPENMKLLHELGNSLAEREVQEDDFPSKFNLV